MCRAVCSLFVSIELRGCPRIGGPKSHHLCDNAADADNRREGIGSTSASIRLLPRGLQLSAPNKVDGRGSCMSSYLNTSLSVLKSVVPARSLYAIHPTDQQSTTEVYSSLLTSGAV